MGINIGSKIRELRRKGGMARKDLAAHLNVSTATVSNWEKNRAEPRLAQVAPLAKALGVTADILLGTGEISADEKYDQLKKEYEAALQTGDTEQIKEICKTAVRLFPFDIWWSWQYNHAFYKRSQENIDCETAMNEQTAREADILKIMIDKTDDPIKRWELIIQLVRNLCTIGRKSEAFTYVSMLPDSPPPSRNDLIDDVFDGNALLSFRQKLMADGFSETLSKLYSSPDATAETDRVIINLIYAMIPDGNYLEFHKLLYLVKKRLVKHLITHGGTADEILMLLEEMHTHSVEYDHIFTSPDALFYTVDHLRFVSTHALPQGGSLRNDFKKYLKRKSFDPFRQEARFVDLVLKGAYM